jgi:hypothetical protein
MTTNWTLPTNVIQYAEEGGEEAHISWLETNDFHGLKDIDGKSVRTTRDLVHIARDPRHDILQKTYYLKLTGFNFLNLSDTLSGIEMRLTINRYGRITDETIQLCSAGVLVGENQASLNLDTKKLYGNASSSWGSNLNMSYVQDLSFGVILRFQSHPNWPHRSSPLIDAVELRIH